MATLSLLPALESAYSSGTHASSRLRCESPLLRELLRGLNRELISFVWNSYSLLWVTIVLYGRILILKPIHLLDRMRASVYRFTPVISWPYRMLILVMAHLIGVNRLCKVMKSCLLWISQVLISILESIWVGLQHVWLIFIVRSYKTWSVKVSVEYLRIVQKILDANHFYSALSIDSVGISRIRRNYWLAINLYRNIICMSVILGMVLDSWHVNLRKQFSCPRVLNILRSCCHRILYFLLLL